MNKQVSRVIAAVSALTLVCGIAPVQPLADTFSSLAVTASAASPENDFEFESGTITGYNGIDAEVEIPEKINNTTVTAIGDFAFQKCQTLTEITLPKTITTIGNGAFSECSSLWEINIPDSVTSIGQGAFWECSALSSIDLPNSVQTVGANAFYNCRTSHISQHHAACKKPKTNGRITAMPLSITAIYLQTMNRNAYAVLNRSFSLKHRPARSSAITAQAVMSLFRKRSTMFLLQRLVNMLSPAVQGLQALRCLSHSRASASTLFLRQI